MKSIHFHEFVERLILIQWIGASDNEKYARDKEKKNLCSESKCDDRMIKKEGIYPESQRLLKPCHRLRDIQ